MNNTVEETPSINASEMNRQGLLVGDSGYAFVEHGGIEYTVRFTTWRNSKTTLKLFRCDYCGKRHRKLYLLKNFFACRECHGLTYAVLGPIHQRPDVIKAMEVRFRLGGAAFIDLKSPFPPRPAKMAESEYLDLMYKDRKLANKIYHRTAAGEHV